MTYEIKVVNIGDWLWEGRADVKNDTGAVVFTSGPIRIACETEEEAKNYVEKTFLPDLRKNYQRQLSALVFPWEVVEPIEEVV